MKLAANIGAVVAALAFAAPSYAANLTFANGSTTVHGAKIAAGSFTDLFTFTASAGDVFSGTIGTHLLRRTPGNPASAVLSNLDFTAASLTDGTTTKDFTIPGAAADETISIPTMALAGGNYILSVSYDVTKASAHNSATYDGGLHLASAAVPEPASWAMFIGGFGLIGAGARRTRRVAPVAFG